MSTRQTFTFCLSIAAWLLMGFTWGDPLSRNTKKGNQLFEAGKYEEALQAFTEADVNSATGDPRLPQLFQNMGNTLTKLGKIDEAIAMYKKAEDAANSATLKADAQYNSGNAWMKQQQYQQAVEAYKQALELNPKHENAQQNKELAEKLLVQQQQEQQQKQQQKNQEQNQQQNQQQQSSQNQQEKQDQQQKDEQQPQNQEQQEQKDQQQNQKPDEQQTQEQQTAQAEQTPEDKEQQLSKEEALRILDALKEKEELQQQQRQVAPRPVEKDW